MRRGRRERRNGEVNRVKMRKRNGQIRKKMICCWERLNSWDKMGWNKKGWDKS